MKLTKKQRVDGTPFFLQAEVLKPFVTEDLLMSTTPIFFIDKGGKKSVGYDARIRPNVADVYLKYRDAMHTEGKPVVARYGAIIRACDALVRFLAQQGIVSLVDRATGYSDDLERELDPLPGDAAFDRGRVTAIDFMRHHSVATRGPESRPHYF